MNRILLSLCLMYGILLGSQAIGQESGKIKTLIIDGQNNHAMWPKTTMMMKKYLEGSGRFTVDIARTQYTWNGKDLLDEYALNDGKQYQNLPQPQSDPDYKPDFSKYDVVVSNFGHNAAPWPEETQKAFEAYVQGGGGVSIIHAANNSFPDWPAYNEIIGIGGWGGRNERSGPYVYFNNDGKRIRDESPGSGGSHGPKHEYQIIVRDTEHPITRGLPTSWLHTSDELYQQLRGPAENMTILATAYADAQYRGSARHEPMIMTIEYGKGRVFHTPMGHDDVSVECVGFITTLLRGTEWAATGKVTLTEIPSDFPQPDASSRRTFSR